MDEPLVIVRTFANRMEAEIARGALEAAGIDSAIQTDDAGGLRPDLSMRFGVHLFVRESEAAEADALLSGGAPDAHEETGDSE
jgi:hypothetical protein